MSISFACACGKQLKVADQFAGKRARCPACAAAVQVPLPEPEPPQPAADPDAAAFDLLNDNSEPESRGKPASRTWDEPSDPSPYRVSAELPPEPKKKSSVDRPRFASNSKRERPDRERSGGITLSAGVIGGIVMMLVAVVWFVVGLSADRIFFYPPVMFVLGLVGVIRGALGLSED